MAQLVEKFKNALNGVMIAFKIDTGVKIQFFLALITLVFSFLFNLNTTEWMIIILCIGMVLGAELLNTSIEKICDYSTSIDYEAKGKIKDISAGAVLVVSIASFIIMLMIILSKGVF